MTRLRLPMLPAPGASLVVPVPGRALPRQSLLLTTTDDGPRAYWNVCQHLPVPLDAGLGTLPRGPELVCSTHGAYYRPEDGVCTKGPCVGAQLEAVRLEREGHAWFAVLDEFSSACPSRGPP